MDTRLVTMTPEWASEILNRNTHNRNLCKKRADFYVALIMEGKWRLTHQGIAIDSNNVLQDGQHRLQAIASSGVAVPIMLSTNCDPLNFDVIDSGKKRSAADALVLSGAKNASRAAAGIKGYIQYKKFPGLVWTGTSTVIDAASIRQFYSENVADVDEIAAYAKISYGHFKKQNASALIAFALIARDHNLLNEALEFIEAMGEGAGLNPYNPILAYRNFLANDMATRSLQEHLAADIKYFNKWLTDEPVRCFRMPDISPMPTIVVSRSIAPIVDQ